MPRPLRIEYEGAWYHVMNRGAACKKIFHTIAHRELFLKLLGEIYEKYKIEIHAYCLMPNHYHLLVRTQLANLQKCMRHLNGVYTQLFNRSTRRDGALYRGRYKAILVDADDYLLQLSRYIHLNPVKARLCNDPREYAWSSYQYYQNRRKKPAWLVYDEILCRFGESNRFEKYKKYISDGVDNDINQLYDKDKIPPILGSEEFKKNIFQRYLSDRKTEREIPEYIEIKNLMIPKAKQIVEAVIGYYKVSESSLKSSRQGEINKARSVFIYLAVEMCQISLRIIGEMAGGITRNGVSNNHKRFSEKLRSDDRLKSELDAICRLI